MLLSAADGPPAGAAERGKLLFIQNCALCHATGVATDNQPMSGQGPNLAGVVGRKAASGAFGYTEALAASKLTWDPATLDRFLASPTALVPGTTMGAAVPQAADRADLIAYLSTLPALAVTPPEAAPRTELAGHSEAGDWRRAAPGMKYHLKAADLPAPYSTASSSNGPRVVHPTPTSRLAVPAGFTVRKFAEGLTNPRLTRVAPNGDIFVAETAARRIRVLRAADGAEAPTEMSVFAEGLDRPFGIAFYPLGDRPEWVYVANNNAVIRFPYRNGDLKARGPAEVIVPQLTKGTGGHSTRDLAFSLDGRRLFISVGSASNVGEKLESKTPEEIRQWEAGHGRGAAWGYEANRADILVTDPTGREPLRTYATGIRNGVGLAVDPATGVLWTSTNERDGLGDDLVPDYITRVREHGYYGWPWYYLGDHEDPRHRGARPDLAGAAIVPDVLIQAHSASLQLTFYPAATGPAAFPAQYHGDVFAALHGSWNRQTRTGYKVIRVRVDHGVPTGAYEDFLTGFVTDDEHVWGRPVGVAVAHDGALLVTEDGNGTIWRVAFGAAR
ncbi:MAG: PQQ-dependent sugar dehydrogenase [Verrucomicrobia bacterium]|nr:PQQ-dependent sugar dehydrogenase [Verrucomicrobiota bacterium]